VTAPQGERALQHLLRDLAPQVLGALARRHGDFADAEDAVQEALIAAASQWPVAGIPDNPRGWLYTVALRRLGDLVRSDVARRRREEAVAADAEAEAAMPPVFDPGRQGDDSLVLLFMCCHSALTPPSAIALTLRAVGGLTTGEIARAFMVPEATMAQRISRAKLAIRASGAHFSLPEPGQHTARLRAVMHSLYLIFNEGYASSSGATLQRTDLSTEAIRLARLLHAHLPTDPEVAGLLALMLLTDARRDARTGQLGEPIPLDQQDRTKWNRAAIAEGVSLLTSALQSGAVGLYAIQAAIAAVHDESARAEDTDWPQVLALYGVLQGLTDNPMVTLNRAIAAAMVHGPHAGLSLLAPLDDDPRLEAHYRLDAVRAHLYEMAGDVERALRHYRAAAARTTSIPERNYLVTRGARLSRSAPAPGEA